MSIAPIEQNRTEQATAKSERNRSVSSVNASDIKPVKRTRRKSTSHLKLVPEELSTREEFKKKAEEFAKTISKSKPFTKSELEKHGRELLAQMDMPETFLGFAMVQVGNFFWKRQFLALPFDRRLLLLPHCLKHAEGCPADYDEFGLDCETCGACSIADYKVKAEKLGYKVLVAEGSPIVLKIIVSGHIDGILGVACLNVLEKAIDKVLIAGVPSYAIPLHSGDCKNTKLDEAWVWDVLEKYEPLDAKETSSYVPLMRSSYRLFEEKFDELLPRKRSQDPVEARAPLGLTENISYDWLKNGGKRFRPFITLAAYDAMTGGEGCLAEMNEKIEFSPAVSRVAMAIETFHKASLVHDDIEDDDQYRYGKETIHRRYDTGTAINVGDYLIGLGYRLALSAKEEFGAEIATDIMDRMANAHVRLCDGQGAEMAWQNSGQFDLSPLDALKIYALKTSPAFEAALYAGMRMSGDIDEYEETISGFSRHLGVGFQILNDLNDWHGDDYNKLLAGQDALAFRPTLLLALALHHANDQQRKDLEEIFTSADPDALRMGRLKRIFEETDAFEKATTLVEKSRNRAEELADNVECEALRRLLYFLVDTVLSENEQLHPTEPTNLVTLPIVNAMPVG